MAWQKHGHAKNGGSPEYSSWVSMNKRCRCKSNPAYSRYGGAGITICERWRDFRNFLEDMGPRPMGYTLERKNNELGYFPKNCKWATRLEQTKNRRIPLHFKSTKGYTYKPHLNKYEACVYIRGKRKYLGVFNTKQEAFAAYSEAICANV